MGFSFFFQSSFSFRFHFIQYMAPQIWSKRLKKNKKKSMICVSSLKCNSTSQKTDTKGLAVIMVKVGIWNTTATNSCLSAQLLTSTNDTLMKKVLKFFYFSFWTAVEKLKYNLKMFSFRFINCSKETISATIIWKQICKYSLKTNLQI